MAYDDVLLRIGEFGRYQRRICLFLFLAAIPPAFHSMGGVFLGAQPDFRCLLPDESLANATYQLPSNIMDFAYPLDDVTNSWSTCERYDLNFTDQYYSPNGNLSSTTVTTKCDSYVYDKTTYTLTTTTEFDAVCDNAWLQATADSMFMAGIMLGVTIFGGLSDKYGRKPIFCIVIIVNLISGLLVAASPDMISYIILRMILGTSANAIYLVAYVAAIEMIMPKRRVIIAITMELFFVCGCLLTAGIAYFVTNWRFLQISLTIPSLVFIAYWWIIPESVRWLLSKGRLQEAKDLILKASIENSVQISEVELDSMLSSNSTSVRPELEKPSVLDLFRYPNLRRKSLLLFFIWVVNNGTYYGLSWNTSNLGGNDYVNFAISAIVEIPACGLVFFTLNRFGRKSMLCVCMILAGISLLLIIFVPINMQWLVVVLAMIGKLAISASFEIVYVFSAEQYPTVIRNVGVGACSTFARIGGIIAPYILYFSGVWAPFPYVIFGSGALMAGLSALLLPETLNEKLPETIQDAEAFGKYGLTDNSTSLCSNTPSSKKITTAKKEIYGSDRDSMSSSRDK